MIRAEILLASYNGEKYIQEQLDSILAQTDEGWHLTVSDDGSTDATARILDAYAARHPHRITRLVSGQRFGNARDHFYWLIRQCPAEHMLTCDQDDRWHEDKVQKLLERMEALEQQYGKETPLLVFCDQTPTDEALNPLSPSLMRYQNQFFEYFDYRSLLMQNVVTGCAMCFNRALAQLALACPAPEKTVMHDWWMALVAARFGQIAYIDEPLSDYRQHASNSVGARDVHSLGHIAHRLSHLQALKQTLRDKKTQAQVFHDAYAARLTREDAAFLAGFTKERSGARFYWQNRKLIHGFFRLAGMMLLG